MDGDCKECVGCGGGVRIIRGKFPVSVGCGCDHHIIDMDQPMAMAPQPAVREEGPAMAEEPAPRQRRQAKPRGQDAGPELF